MKAIDPRNTCKSGLYQTTTSQLIRVVKRNIFSKFPSLDNQLMWAYKIYLANCIGCHAKFKIRSPNCRVFRMTSFTQKMDSGRHRRNDLGNGTKPQEARRHAVCPVDAGPASHVPSSSSLPVVHHDIPQRTAPGTTGSSYTRWLALQQAAPLLSSGPP